MIIKHKELVKLKTLFDATQLSGLRLKNRFIRSATHDGRADDLGHPTPKLVARYEALAQGGVGTIITGLMCVTDREKIARSEMAIYNDSFVPEYKKLTQAVHGHNANIIAQLVCNGAQSMGRRPGVMWVPSAIEGDPALEGTVEMTAQDIAHMEEDFISGALRAKAAGFDGVQLHVAHGYLLSRFLTPYYNRRTDDYGGSAENRARVVVEICQRMRQAVGPDYPIWAKINCEDFADEGGFTFEECRKLCKKLEEVGLSAVEVSGGTRLSRENEGTIRRMPPQGQSYFKDQAAALAELLEIPVVLVGGNRDFDKLTDLINQTKIAYVSLSRPFIREPDLINRWASGDRTPAKCISCTKCFSKETECIFRKQG